MIVKSHMRDQSMRVLERQRWFRSSYLLGDINSEKEKAGRH
jgi:hypothetical protein